ncbi:tetratricopeptide repeat protein [Oleidesulfovibrio sp.]|uniref:tetratricopeptide repeat protein n=1 Tax=Oleidesulfovibrio sp. TaxID=2909707 RepID=UPI003A887163
MSQSKEEQTTLLDQLSAEVNPAADPALSFVLNNIKTISMAIGAVVLLAGGAAAYSWNSESSLKQSQADLGMIVATKTGANRLSALEAFSAKAGSELGAAVNYEIAKVSIELKQYDRAAEAYKALAAQSDADAAMTAKLGLAQVYMKQGKPAEAVTVLKPLVTGASAEAQNTINRMIGEAAMEAGDYNQALSAFEALQPVVSADEKGYIEYRIQKVKQRLQAKS